MFYQILRFAFLFLCASTAFADNSMSDYFSVDSTCGTPDLSVQYLQQLFGSVGSVLADPSSCNGGSGVATVFGVMFAGFNTIALGLGVMMISYTIGLGILNTAESGKFLGEKLSSVWIPVRTALGTALLVPASGGYCVAQMMMMWIILNGVGAANTIWTDAVSQWTPVPAPAVAYGVESTDIKTAYSVLGNILNAELCRALNGPSARLTAGTAVYPIYNPGSVAAGTSAGYTLTYSTSPNGTTTNIDNTCGQMIFNQVTTGSFPNESGTTAENLAIQGNFQLVYQTMQSGFVPLPIDSPLATVPATNGNDLSSVSAANAVLGTLIYNIANQGGSVSPPSGDPTTDLAAWLPYVDAARTWAYNYALMIKNGSVTPFLGDKPPPNTELSELYSGGWLTAGQYYFKLAKMSQTSTGDGSSGTQTAISTSGVMIPGVSAVVPTTMTAPPKGWPDKYSNSTYQPILQGFMNTLTGAELNKIYLYGNHALDINQQNSAASGTASATPTSLPSVGAGLQQLANAYSGQSNGMSLPGASIMNNFASSVTSFSQNNADPIYALSQTGASMMQIAADAIVAVLVIAPVISAFTGLCSAESSWALVTQATLLTILPIIYTVLGAIYVEGGLLAVYLPLIPLMSFLVGAIGWLMVVIESMAAAPIIAMGLTIPEGQHDILGRAEPAMMMTLNLLLRPVLMIVGFVMAVILLRPVLNLFNVWFVQFVQDQAIHTDNIFGYAILLAAYITSVMTIAQRVFGLITQLPDRVLSWIGDHGPATAGAEQMLSEAKGAVQSRASSIGSGAGEASRAFAGSKMPHKDKKDKKDDTKGKDQQLTS